MQTKDHRQLVAAEVSRGAFYKYFSSPGTLVRKLATDIINELIRMATSPLKPVEVLCGGLLAETASISGR